MALEEVGMQDGVQRAEDYDLRYLADEDVIHVDLRVRGLVLVLALVEYELRVSPRVEDKRQDACIPSLMHRCPAWQEIFQCQLFLLGLLILLLQEDGTIEVEQVLIGLRAAHFNLGGTNAI